MTAFATSSGTHRLGRFELKRVLGKGAQATVWLAHDARLDRDVAVKLLSPGADSVAVNQWMHEARAVSRLAHPNIVPVFEADELDGQSYLVFEFVDGPTLAQALKARGALSANEVVTMMLGVLDALAVAHAQGIVHRDLKPSNILIGKDGRARVMDFGIAARVAGGSAEDIGRIVGTPGYMSPEAARGDKPTPAMDVFSAGLLLGEMLAGAPLLRERDPYEAIRRVQHEDMLLPAGCDGDDGLRAIIARALARDATQRYSGAAALHRALTDWRKPTAMAAEAGAAAGGTSGTLEFLLRRMRQKSDFPGLSSSITRIQRVATSESGDLKSLVQEVQKDVALTNKLLRMVNTVHFGQAGAGGVTTLSRAVALVGFAGIRNMALSLVLLERMDNKVHAQQLKDDFLRSLMAGHLASELTSVPREADETFLGALFQNLGRLLTGFYFPEEAAQIRALVVPAGGTRTQIAPPLDEALASARVLGIGYEELGIGVAKSWGLPDSLCACMRKPAGVPPGRLVDNNAERRRLVAAAANEVADLLVASEPAEAAQRIGAIAENYATALGVTPAVLRASVGRAREKLVHMASAMSIVPATASPARRLLEAESADTLPATLARQADPLESPPAQATQAMLATPPMGAVDLDIPVEMPTLVVTRRTREAVIQLLSTGIQDISSAMVSEGFKLNVVLRQVLETMWRAVEFRRVLFCLRDPKTDTLTGRFGLGDRASELAALFKVPLKLAPGANADLFTAVCLKGADTLITDASAPAISARLPAWHRENAAAPTFLLLPLAMKGAPFALIYADNAHPGAIDLEDRELNLLRTLRNQAVMAFRQVS